MKISYPEDLPESMGQTSEEFEREIKFIVAAKLYEMGRISSGRAAELWEQIIRKLKIYPVKII